MRIKEGFLLKEVADNFVVVPVGENLVDFSKMITLNETGALLWEALKKDCSVDDLVNALMSEYVVDKPTARDDVLAFLGLLRGEGVLSE